MQYRYFKTRHGSAAPRFGTTSFLGCKRTPEGFVWKKDEVSRVPESEFKGHNKSYRRALSCGALVEVKESDWDAWIKATQAASKAAGDAVKAKRAADQKAAQELKDQQDAVAKSKGTVVAEAEDAFEAVLGENDEGSLDGPPNGGSEISEAPLPSRSRRGRTTKKKNPGDKK